MRYSDPLLPPDIQDDPKFEALCRAIYEMEKRRITLPTFTVDNGSGYAQGVYDFLRFTGAKLATIGSNGLEVNFNPYYAICRVSTAVATVTAETKVTPLATSLSGFTNSSDVLTCSNAGKYRLDMSASFRTNTSGDVINIGYRINGGTTIFPIQHAPNATTYHHREATVYLSLAASDTVEFRVSTTGAGNSDLAVGTGLSLIQISS